MSILLAVILLGTAACAPQRVQIQPSDLMEMRKVGQIRAIALEGASYTHVGGIGLLGYAIAKEFGAEIVENHQAEDPVVALRASLLDQLQEKQRLSAVASDGVVTKETADRLQASMAEQYLLAVRTNSWMLEIAGIFMHRMRVEAQGQLVRRRDGQILWLSRCVGRGRQEALPGDFKNDGALLKAETRLAAEECARRLFEDFQGRP